MSDNIEKVEQESENESINLRDLFFLCLSRWYWFAISLIICLGLGVFYLLRTPPVYTRTASILIKVDSKGNSTISDFSVFGDLDMFQNKTNINNEIATFQSPDLLADVVEMLDLRMTYMVAGRFHKDQLYGENVPAFVSIFNAPQDTTVLFEYKLLADSVVVVSDFKKGKEKVDVEPIKGRMNTVIDTPVGQLIVRPGDTYMEEPDLTVYAWYAPLKKTVERYEKRLTVTQDDEKSSVINLSVRDVCPNRAIAILNAIIAVYNRQWIDDKNQIASSTSDFIDERLAVIMNELGNVDSDISTYKSQNLLPDIKTVSNMYMDRANKANAEILNLNNQLYMAQFVKQYLIDPAKRYQLLPVNSGFESAAIANQIGQYNTKLIERNTLLANSSDQNPIVKDMDVALAEMSKSIILAIDNQIETLRAKIKTQEAYEGEAISKIATNPQQARYLLSVERQQKVKESLYLYLLQKREENELSQAFTAYNTRVIVNPTGPDRPTSPNRRNILIVAFFMGLLIPFSIIYMRESFNTRVRGRKDLEKLTIPYIGEIPLSYNKKKKFWQKQVGLGDGSVVVKEGSRNIANEAFRVVRTNLEFMLGAGHHVVAMTSANPGSGKTFIVFNLADSLAIKGKKVITVDLDLRRGSQSKYAGSPKTGVADYLAGRVDDLHSLIVHHASDTKVDVLPMGTMPPNPTELLFSPRLAELVETLRGEYDYVFLDCPPVEIVADAAIINQLADKTIFIIRANLFERAMLPEVEKFYTTNKYKNLILLLNGTANAGGRYGSRYGYRYGYHYGYGYGSYGSRGAYYTTDK